MTDRKPLQLLTEEVRRQRLQEMGLDENMEPISATELEKAVNKHIREGFHMEPEVKPLLSGKSLTIIGAVGSLLGLAASAVSGIALVPAWAPFVLSALGAICMNLVGRSMPPLVLGPKALAPEKLIPLCKSAAVAIGAFASTLTPGWLQGAALLLASILYGLAGVVAPQDVKVVEK